MRTDFSGRYVEEDEGIDRDQWRSLQFSGTEVMRMYPVLRVTKQAEEGGDVGNQQGNEGQEGVRVNPDCGLGDLGLHL